MVTAGSMTANLAAYVMQLVASRWLGLAGYSEFASLLAAQLVLAVPALALQTVVAREVVHGVAPAALRKLGLRCAALVAVAALLLVPVLAVVQDVGVGSAAAALLVAPVLVVLAAEQGLLQGEGRFRELAIVLGGAGMARVVPAIVALAFGAGPAAALAASAFGTAAVTVLARAAAPNDSGALATIGVGTVLLASQVQLVLIALSSTDLVLARVVLNDDDASRYALGAIATKIAFWLPQAVGVVLYPRMARPDQSVRAVRSALGLLVALGALAVAGAAVAAPLAPILAGDDYAPITGLLWAFAASGACVAVLQGALLSSIAGRRTRLAAIAWGGLAIEIPLILVFGHSIGALVAIAAGSAAVITVVVCGIELARTNVETVVATPTNG